MTVTAAATAAAAAAATATATATGSTGAPASCSALLTPVHRRFPQPVRSLTRRDRRGSRERDSWDDPGRDLKGLCLASARFPG